MKNQDFLFEIRTEEIPAPTLMPARLELARRLSEALAEESLPAASVESYATPRRLAVVLRGLPEKQGDRFAEVLGPPESSAFKPDGTPSRAAEGFAKAQKVDVTDLVVVDSPRGRTVAARKTIPGRDAAEVLAEIVPRVVSELTFPKTMRWGAGERSFVRPVRGALAVLDGRVVPMEVFGVAAGDRTAGHRILSDGDFAVTGPDDYLEKLRGRFVEPDPEARRVRILEDARAKATEVSGSIEANADLANTLADLVEWPGLVRGSYSPEFLELPEEVTVTAMRTHQKFLPVRGPSGLLPYFIAVMDNSEDRRGFIAKGCEWVLNARLADARFFFEDDVRQSLESRLPELEKLTFQDKLGSYRLEDGAHPGARGVDRGRRRPGGPRRGRAHREPALEGRPDDAARQGVHGPAGDHGRDLRAARAPSRLRVEGDLRPVPAGLRDRRSAAQGRGRDPLAG